MRIVLLASGSRGDVDGLELQSGLSSGIRQRRYTTVVFVGSAIKTHALDAGRQRFFGNRFADDGSRLFAAALDSAAQLLVA